MRYKTAVLFAFCLIWGLLAGSSAAFASTVNKVLDVPTIRSASQASLGTLLVQEEYPMSLKAGDNLSVNLPDYIGMNKIRIAFSYDYDVTSVSSSVYSIDNVDCTKSSNYIDNSGIDGGIISVQVENNQHFTLRVNKIPENPTAKTFRFYIYFDNVTCKIKAPDGAEAKVVLDGSGGFSSDTQTIAKVYAYGDGTTATADSPGTLTDQGGQLASIIIKENGRAALETNYDATDPDNCEKQKTVKLVLAAGVTWTDVSLLPDWGFKEGDIDYKIGVDTSGRSVLYLQINNQTTDATGPGRIIITGKVSVDSSIVQPGKVEVSYEGDNPGVVSTTLYAADYVESGCKAMCPAPTEVIAGHVNQATGNFVILQGMGGDLTQGRTITLTLPDGVRWHNYPVNNTMYLGKAVAVDNDGRMIKYTVLNTTTTNNGIIMRNGSVDLAFDAPPQVEITVGGSILGINNSKVKIATVINPIKLTVAKTDVAAGKQGQAVGDLVINEVVAGTLRALDTKGNQAVLEIKLPAGVTFSNDKAPGVEVTDGNLILFTDQISLSSTDRNTLLIPVNKSSSVASTIKISNIILDVNRVVPEGVLDVEVGGTALTETGDLFTGSQNLLKVPLINCITAALQATSTKAIFTIDNKSYVVNGKNCDMDVAPYIKNDRVYGPVRYIAYALGLSEQDIQWDEATQTVTLMHDGRVVQMTLGLPSMTLQGTKVPIDVAPEMVDPGRLMLPYRWVATALNGKITWDEDNKQVIVQN